MTTYKPTSLNVYDIAGPAMSGFRSHYMVRTRITTSLSLSTPFFHPSSRWMNISWIGTSKLVSQNAALDST
ncbi:hypothetical protein AG1IA_03029 [Rhizoctonia solani AG-1 IA]|uniref:Uncharacterized protein n=1 Tax=Thanatephorus cucumeris (strain AG1-IA) TaxID=983506 RepID=L8X1P9_THACA|nr:hypothetical protein AG1IA_03029 [Rhizoctonia solani AG-1 IA]